ncbi:MAG: DUF5666 domain-containing protein [Candidatus Manganitrophus sp. SA1]|nr:DUF5666 domain-containing protein [Candidatus Manganitrophus morganii]
MRKAIAVVLSLLCAGLFAAASVAAEEAAGDEKSAVAAQKGRMTSIKGEITEIDPTGSHVKVKEKNQEVTISVTDNTIITAGKIKRTLADLKAGDQVVARFTEEDGRKIARSIRVATVGKGSGKKPPAPEAEAPREEAPATEAPPVEPPAAASLEEAAQE